MLVTCLLSWMPASRVSAFLAQPAPATTARSFCGECGHKQVRDEAPVLGYREREALG